jgi:hypothetical protein
MAKRKQRGNGEGSIYSHKKNGKKVGYRGAYTIYTASGWKRRYVTGRMREEAHQKLTKAMAERDGGLVFDAGTLTVGEYFKRWLTDSVRGSVRRSTYQSYRRQMERYVVPTLGQIKLTNLTHMHVQGLYWQMQDRGLSARTVFSTPTPSYTGP